MMKLSNIYVFRCTMKLWNDSAVSRKKRNEMWVWWKAYIHCVDGKAISQHMGHKVWAIHLFVCLFAFIRQREKVSSFFDCNKLIYERVWTANVCNSYIWSEFILNTKRKRIVYAFEMRYLQIWIRHINWILMLNDTKFDMNK